MTTDKQSIRLSSIDAPELGLCGSVESKKYLEKLVLNKNLYIKISLKDTYSRSVAQVYNESGSVSQQMLSAGWAIYARAGYDDGDLSTIVAKAKKDKKGIYSEMCTQTVNNQNPKCLIKGNLLFGANTKIYRYPDCGQYGNTLVQLHLGDQWFCTEKEALSAGFTRGSDCP